MLHVLEESDPEIHPYMTWFGSTPSTTRDLCTDLDVVERELIF